MVTGALKKSGLSDLIPMMHHYYGKGFHYHLLLGSVVDPHTRSHSRLASVSMFSSRSNRRSICLVGYFCVSSRNFCRMSRPVNGRAGVPRYSVTRCVRTPPSLGGTATVLDTASASLPGAPATGTCTAKAV